MKIISIFLLGLGILSGAIVLNYFAYKIGLISWFDFLKDPSKANIFSYIWLFIFYPFGLGTIAYFVYKILNI